MNYVLSIKNALILKKLLNYVTFKAILCETTEK